MATSYNYTAADFLAATQFDLSALEADVNAALTVSVQSIVQDENDDFEFIFAAALSGPDETALDGVVAAYTYSDPGEPLARTDALGFPVDGFSAALVLGGTPTANRTVTVNVADADSTVNLPSVGTLATLAGTETFTNKTITSTTNDVAAKGLLSATTNVDVFASAAPTENQTLVAASGTAAAWTTPFGAFFQFAEDLTVSSTTSNTLQSKLILTTTSLPSGRYIIYWSYRWRYSAASRDFISSVELNGTPFAEHRQEPKDPQTNQAYYICGQYISATISGVNTVEILYRSQNGSDTAEISEARIFLYSAGLT